MLYLTFHVRCYRYCSRSSLTLHVTSASIYRRRRWRSRPFALMGFSADPAVGCGLSGREPFWVAPVPPSGGYWGHRDGTGALCRVRLGQVYPSNANSLAQERRSRRPARSSRQVVTSSHLTPVFENARANPNPAGSTSKTAVAAGQQSHRSEPVFVAVRPTRPAHLRGDAIDRPATTILGVHTGTDTLTAALRLLPGSCQARLGATRRQGIHPRRHYQAGVRPVTTRLCERGPSL